MNIIKMSIAGNKNIIIYVLLKLFVFFLDFDECASNPCQNGGTCTNKEKAFTCSCLHFFWGTHCEDGEKDFTSMKLWFAKIMFS